MTRTVDSKNQIWFERDNATVKVGFTKSFLEGLNECWHIIPARMDKFRERAPLLVVETNDSLISILSPVTANFMEWSEKAQNFPDKLTEDDVVLQMTTQGVARSVPQPVQVVNMADIEAVAERIRNGNGLAMRPAAPTTATFTNNRMDWANVQPPMAFIQDAQPEPEQF